MGSDITKFLRYLEQSDRSPLTIRNYKCDLESFAIWFEETNGDPLQVASIAPTDLREYKQYLSAESTGREGHRGLKPASINRKLATLKSLLKWAVEAELIPSSNLLRLPKIKREQKHAPKWLDRKEQHKLLRAVEKDGNIRDIAIVNILMHTGLRVGELSNLNWQDIRITDRRGSLTVANGKGSKQRTVQLNADARGAFISLGYSKNLGDTPVFTGQRGRLTSRGVQSMLAKYSEQAKLDQVSPHSLRHTFCKNLIDAGVGLQVVAEIAGHESLDTTRLYCRSSVKDLERAVELIECAG